MTSNGATGCKCRDRSRLQVSRPGHGRADADAAPASGRLASRVAGWLPAAARSGRCLARPCIPVQRSAAAWTGHREWEDRAPRTGVEARARHGARDGRPGAGGGGSATANKPRCCNQRPTKATTAAPPDCMASVFSSKTGSVAGCKR